MSEWNHSFADMSAAEYFSAMMDEDDEVAAEAELEASAAVADL